LGPLDVTAARADYSEWSRFLELVFSEVAEILRIWQGGVKKKGATVRPSRSSTV